MAEIDAQVERLRAENQAAIGEEPDIESLPDEIVGDIAGSDSDDLIASHQQEYLDPLDQQGAVGTQQYRAVLAAQGYAIGGRRPPARLQAEPPVVYLYGEVETAGTIVYAGPRSQVRKFTKGTNYASDKTDFTYVDDEFYDLNGLLFGVGKNADDLLAAQFLAPKTGLVDTSADLVDQISRAQYDLTATYDQIIALSEGEIEAWGTTIEMYIAQPGRDRYPQFGVVTLHRQTANYGGSTRVWYEPAAAGNSITSKGLAGRLRVIPYLTGGSTNPVTWSLAHTTYEVKRQGYNQVGQKIGSEASQGFYRSPWDHTCRLKGISYVHIVYANSAKGAWLDAGETQIRPPTQARTVGYWDVWQGQPVFRFRIKGRKFSYPGQATAHYTNNAAAVRYDIERTLRGTPASLIDEDSVEAAVTTCGATVQLRYAASPHANVPATVGGSFDRYTLSGEVLGTETLPKLEQQLDFAWQGRTNLERGRLVFKPGKLPTTHPRVEDADVVAIGAASMTPDLGRRVNTLVDGQVLQDAFRQYSPVGLPPVTNSSLQTKDGLDLDKSIPPLRFVNNYYAGLYLLHIYAATQWMREQFVFTLSPGTEATYYGITPRSVLEWRVDQERETPLDIWQYKQTGHTYPLLWVRNIEIDAFTRAVHVTVSPLTTDPFQPDLKLAVDPGNYDLVDLAPEVEQIGPPPVPEDVVYTDEGSGNVRITWSTTGDWFTQVELQVNASVNPLAQSWVTLRQVDEWGQEVTLSNLPNGEYRFRLRHVTLDGIYGGYYQTP